MPLKNIFALLLFTAALSANAQKPQAPQQEDILKAMRLANHYFMAKWPDAGKEIVTRRTTGPQAEGQSLTGLNRMDTFRKAPFGSNNIARPSSIWTRAVYYEGLMSLYSIDPQKEYYDYAVSWGTKHNWTPRNGVTNRNADDQCAGQTWIDLFNIDAQPERVANIKTCIDNMVHSDKCDDWHWIDAIQMAMPVFTRLGVLYHDTSYFRKMYDLYHFTKTVHGGHGLYSPDQHLWWRDKDFVPPYKEPNGQDCFWSRGNGWVLAALARTLSILPLNDPHRAEYLQDYLDMINAIVPLQRADGYWNVSLHDSTHFGGPELTGTALFTYSIAWGIREGYLDKKQYIPIITRSWNALTSVSLHPDGMLGYVQGTGKEPKDGQPVSYDKIPDFEDYGLGCFLLAGSELYQIATPPVANLDESKVPPYQETPLALSTVKNWETVQRPEIYQLFEKNVYGRMPDATIPVSYTTDEIDTTGFAIKKLITFHFSPADTGARLHLMLYLPKGKGKAPVFVGYSFTPNNITDTSSQWPIKTIVGRGFGVAVAWYWDIEPDRADGWETGIRTRLAGPLNIQPYEWSAMGAWAWGLERIVDYLQNEPKADTKRLIVIGHSRLGKAAVWAGASDKRFALVVSNESGEGGAALGKRDYGETIAIINDKFPWWFAPAYKQYGANPAAMPFDQFMLLSLVAPRPLYVASAIGDQWSDPKGEFLSATLADPVYKLYHEKGVGSGSMPPLEHPVGEYIRYHIRKGKHDMTLYDWQQYMDFADQRLKEKK